jgi:TM2 domain-containing membrane protein YozV
VAKPSQIGGETVWLINDASSSSRSTRSNAPAIRDEMERNPAVAFSLSLWVWGGGQFYNRQWQLGVFYLLAMVNFYLVPTVIMHYWSTIESGLATLDVTASELLAALGIFFLTGLMVWVMNAVQAYFGAGLDEGVMYEGVRHPFLPAVCSLIIPGWGQFLNGQTKKGVCFLIAAMGGLYAVAVALVIPFLWPTLSNEVDRRFAEGALFVAWMLVPPVLLVWIGSVYDAVKVCVDPLKKQPIRERFDAAINRMRLKGWGGVWSQLQLTLMLSLYLVFCLAVSRYYFPQDFYVSLIHDLRTRTAQQQMEFIPKRLDQLSRLIFPAESRK